MGRLFQPFTQLDTGDRRTAKGIGYEPSEAGGACFAVALPAADAWRVATHRGR